MHTYRKKEPPKLIPLETEEDIQTALGWTKEADEELKDLKRRTYVGRAERRQRNKRARKSRQRNRG